MIGSIVFNCDKTGLGNKEQESRTKRQGIEAEGFDLLLL